MDQVPAGALKGQGQVPNQFATAKIGAGGRAASEDEVEASDSTWTRESAFGLHKSKRYAGNRVSTPGLWSRNYGNR